jgi:hypothetical protein
MKGFALMAFFVVLEAAFLLQAALPATAPAAREPASVAQPAPEAVRAPRRPRPASAVIPAIVPPDGFRAASCRPTSRC